MIYYKLPDLLVFLEECKHEEYNPIEDIIETLNDRNLSEKDKGRYVLAILRYHGLLEAKIDELKSEMKFVSEPVIFKGTINVMQLFTINFDNGELKFYQNLN